MKSQPYSFRIPMDLKFHIDNYAHHIGTRPCDAIRHIIMSHLDAHFFYQYGDEDENGNIILPSFLGETDECPKEKDQKE